MKPFWTRDCKDVTHGRKHFFFYAAGLRFLAVRLFNPATFFFSSSVKVHLHYCDGSCCCCCDPWQLNEFRHIRGKKRADSAPALGDAANKRSPRAFVCMNIVSGALVQNINNAGGRGCRGATREAKQISGAHNGLIPMAVLSIMSVGETASGPGSLLSGDGCQLWKICRNFWKVLLPRNSSAHPFSSRANLKAAAGRLITNRHENI